MNAIPEFFKGNLKSRVVGWLLRGKPRPDFHAFTSALSLVIAQVLIEHGYFDDLGAYFRALGWALEDPDLSQKGSISSSALAILHRISATLVFLWAVSPKEFLEVVHFVDKDLNPEPFTYPSDCVSYEVLQDVGHDLVDADQPPSELSLQDARMMETEYAVLEFIEKANPQQRMYLDLLSQGVSRAEAARRAGLNERSSQNIERKLKRFLAGKATRRRGIRIVASQGTQDPGTGKMVRRQNSRLQNLLRSAADKMLEDERAQSSVSGEIRRDRREQIVQYWVGRGWDDKTVRQNFAIIESYLENRDLFLHSGRKARSANSEGGGHGNPYESPQAKGFHIWKESHKDDQEEKDLPDHEEGV